MSLTACVVAETDYVRASAPGGTDGFQVLLADTRSGSLRYSVTGVREQELSQHISRRVEITGTLEPPRTTPLIATADGARTGSINTGAPASAGVTPEGGAAHEPSDALAATVRAGRVAEPVPNPSDPAYRVATLPRLNATSFKPVAGACPPPPGARPVQADRASAPQSRPAVPGGRLAGSAPQTDSVTVRGCLMRATAEGTALTPQATPSDRLVLTRAAQLPQAPGSVAVPGSAPAGSGSGTVPNSAAGRAPVDVGTLTFELSGAPAGLSSHIGERVEINGTLGGDTPGQPGAAASKTPGRVQQASDPAHPSAPAQTLSVRSFRAVGGACN